MKSILLVLFSIFTIVSGHAQKTVDPPVTQENVRLALAQGMANFTNSVKPYYLKGQDQQKFITQVCGIWKPTTEGNALLAKAYEFIITGYTADGIIKSYSGNEMAASLLYLKPIHDLNPKSDGSELFGGKASESGNALARSIAQDCRWYQIWCHLQAFANWVVANWDTIERILHGLGIIR